MARLQDLIGIAAVALSIICILLYNFTFWHIVQEGNVGFYYRLGKMQESMTEPGLHFKLPPPITTAIQVYVRPQVDSVKYYL